MATVALQFTPAASILPATGRPQHKVIQGTAFPLHVLAFDAGAEEAAFFVFRAGAYGSGNLTLDLDWYADSASSADVIWGAAVGVITPNTDSQDIETKALATAQVVTDTHLGTTGQRLHRATVTISNLDSLAADDWVVLKVYRDADDVGDTMTGDAFLVLATLSYSDT